MNITDYFEKLNGKSQQIFLNTLSDTERLGKVHHISSGLYEFSKYIDDADEKTLLNVVCSQLESSCLALSYGLYRQALTSLRLAFEVGLGFIHFSVHKMEHKEWLNGSNDIRWSSLIDENNGVLSVRFSNAFFPELREHISTYNGRAKTIYRALSEFVHGNSETWKESGITLCTNDTLKAKYFDSFDEVAEILIFAICCRYLKGFNSDLFDEVQAVTEELSHVAPIRELTGGPKEIK